MITIGDIACCYDARVAVYEIEDASDLSIPSIPPVVAPNGQSFPVTLGDIASHWTKDFVAIVDAEMEVVALVPRSLSATIVNLMNLAEPMLNVIDRAEEASVADRESTRGAARRETEEADERLRLAIAEMKAVP